VTHQQGVHVKQCTACLHSYHNKMLQTVTLHSVQQMWSAVHTQCSLSKILHCMNVIKLAAALQKIL